LKRGLIIDGRSIRIWKARDRTSWKVVSRFVCGIDQGEPRVSLPQGEPRLTRLRAASP